MLIWILAAALVVTVLLLWLARQRQLRARDDAARRETQRLALEQAEHAARAQRLAAAHEAQQKAEREAAEAAAAQAREQAEREARQAREAAEAAAAAEAEAAAAVRAAQAEAARQAAAALAQQEAERQAREQAEREAARAAAEAEAARRAEEARQAETARLAAEAQAQAQAAAEAERLAREQAEQQAAAAASAAIASPRRELRVDETLVLVADDSKIVRVKLSRLLNGQGYRVALAESGEQALELMAAERPHVLITDVEMPGIDGFELTRQVRAAAATAQLPVLMITSSDDKREAADAAGVTQLLGKPFSEEALLAAIEQARLAVRLPA